MTNLIEQFEDVHASVCENVIQHDTKRKVWNGVDELEVGHIVTFEGECLATNKSGEPALITVLSVNSNGDVKAQLEFSKGGHCCWRGLEQIRPVTRKIVHSGVDGDIMANFIPA